ncbi:MAG: hypothetical protein QXY49_00300 [Thermofilaceae archaeon]
MGKENVVEVEVDRRFLLALTFLVISLCWLVLSLDSVVISLGKLLRAPLITVKPDTEEYAIGSIAILNVCRNEWLVLKKVKVEIIALSGETLSISAITLEEECAQVTFNLSNAVPGLYLIAVQWRGDVIATSSFRVVED